MSQPRIEARIGPCVRVGVAAIDGCRLAFHKRGKDGSGKCDAHLTGSGADRLYGVVFGVDEHQARTLDGFEGPGYYRRYFRTEMPQGPRFAYAYVAYDWDTDGSLIPYDWYHQFVLTGAIAGGVPASHIEMISKVKPQRDLDIDRRQKNAEILAGEREDSL
ncbi:MAG: gamma-glutamylcyclotransferase [Gammaproteobacteria bacterium]|nr:gamma-glutamylcyclotransferase [Gammaproteobacteria bacterium]